MMRMALNLLVIIVPLQIVLGDLHGRNTLAHQPAKLAAIEGLWQSAGPMPEALFAIPDQGAHKNYDEINIPHLGSLILTHSWNGRVRGLEEWPPDQWPPVWPVFFAFRIMVGIALLMLAVVIVGWVLRLRGNLYDSVWFFAPLSMVCTGRFCGGADGLDDLRGRAPALDGLWGAPHRGFGHTFADRP
jgi:cytochrome bd ubiquinol oxidase subunit I